VKKGGLGGGLLGRGQGSNVEAILGLEAAGEAIQEIRLDLLQKAPWQPRGARDREALDVLAESIREHGVLEPLLARRDGDGFQLLAGHRRLDAARMAKLTTVPVRLLEADDTTARAVTLTENLAREDLTAWEEAQGLAALRDLLGQEGKAPTLAELARLTGRSRAHLSEYLKIADGLDLGGMKRADIHAVNTLPKAALLNASRAVDSTAKRAVLEAAIRATGDGKAPGKATEPHRPRKAGRRPAPYVLTVREDGRVSLALRRPVGELKPKDAAALVERLDPILKALRRRAREA